MVRLVSLSDAFHMLSLAADMETEPQVELDEEPASSLNVETKTSRE